MSLNERSRRRIGADLHDGPAQALALALLRLEDGPSRGPISDDDLVTVRRAVNDALVDLRSIAADLRMPALTHLSVAEVAERAVRDHEHHAGTKIALHLERMPEQVVPLAIKIALLRTLQEALSNATRHGLGRDVAVRLASDGVTLQLEVRDAGPGFAVTSVADGDHLGLEGMRERTELLGGTFSIESSVGNGTVVRASWPLAVAVEDE
jgi:signal transduction histidine kinase